MDLAQLVEEATEGSWIGYRARHSSEIGSVYSPRNDEDAAAQNVRLRSHVETVIDIGYRSKVNISLVMRSFPSSFALSGLDGHLRKGWDQTLSNESSWERSKIYDGKFLVSERESHVSNSV